MTIAKKAEKFVLKQLNKKPPKKYGAHPKDGDGFDIRKIDFSHFIEVKGTSKQLNDINFRYLTDKQYEKAKWCIKKKKKYQVFLVTGVGSRKIEIAKKVLARDFPFPLKAEKSWRLPIPK